MTNLSALCHMKACALQHAYDSPSPDPQALGEDEEAEQQTVSHISGRKWNTQHFQVQHDSLGNPCSTAASA